MLVCHQDLSVYTLFHCNKGEILQSIETNEAKFEKFKHDSENQIVTNSTNNISPSIWQQDRHVLVQWLG